MTLAYEDLRIAPTQPMSISADAASVYAPELEIASDMPLTSTDVDFGESIFLSTEDRHAEKQRLLRHMNNSVGTTHVSLAYAAALTAPWVVEDWFAKELANWDGAFECIPYAAMPTNAKSIRSHDFCRIKIANEGKHFSHLSLKTRIVLHGNEDNQKEVVRKDTQAASFTAIRILLTLAALHKFHIASLDIKGEYLQSGLCKRYVFVRPPNEWPGALGVVWNS
jgi:hypothetical protein